MKKITEIKMFTNKLAHENEFEAGLQEDVNNYLLHMYADYNRPEVKDIKYCINPTHPDCYSAMIIFEWEVD